MNKILVLWATPRSTSTAFEWMMRQRGDMECFHEPFGEAWYQGENPLWPRVQENSLRILGLSLEGVFTKLKKKQLDYVLSLAKKYGMKKKALEYINQDKKIFYYGGAYELYNPQVNRLKKWNARLQKLNKK